MIIVGLLSVNLHAKDVITYDVYYFHATMRCEGCIRIEDFTQSSLQSSFSKQLQDSLIKFSSIDFLQPENGHFQDDYQFDSQTLVISKRVNGKEVKWKNLDKIWDVSSDPEKFKKYITKEIKKFIKA